MAPIKRKYRTIYIVTAALMVAMIGGYALAATTVTTLSPGQTSNVTNTPNPLGFSAATISSEQLVVITVGMAGVHPAGNQTGGVGLAGGTWSLLPCAANPCTPQNFRPVTPVTPAVGDYGEQIVLSVSPSVSPAASVPFDFSITVSMNVLGVTSSVVAQGYLATNVAAVSGITVPVYLFVDLGTTTAPAINSLSVVFNQCSSPTSCP